MTDIREDRIIMTAPGVWTTPVIDTSPATTDEKWWNQPKIKLIRATSVTKTVEGRVHPVAGPYTISQLPSPGHVGIDFAGKQGTPIVSFGVGEVTRIQRTPEPGGGYGLAVFVRDIKTGLEVTYAHLQNILVAVGDVLRPGEQLGTMGSTGSSSGSHLHFEIGTLGAQPFHGKRSEAGAVDPRPFLAGLTPTTSPGLMAGSPAQATSGLYSIGADYFTIPTNGSNGKSESGWWDELRIKGLGLSSSRPAVGSTAPAVGFDMYGGQEVEVEEAEKAEEDPSGFFAPFERMGKSAGEGIKRAGFMAAGFALLGIGLLMLAYSYRRGIGEVAKVGVQAGTMIANPAAGAVTAAVV